MSVRVRCPKCVRDFEVAQPRIGMVVSCPDCGRKLALRGPDVPAQEALLPTTQQREDIAAPVPALPQGGTVPLAPSPASDILRDLREWVVTSLGCLLGAAPFAVAAVLGLWYAACGSITWLRWVVGVLGAVCALPAAYWCLCLLPCVASILFFSFLLTVRIRWWKVVLYCCCWCVLIDIICTVSALPWRWTRFGAYVIVPVLAWLVLGPIWFGLRALATPPKGHHAGGGGQRAGAQSGL